MKSQTPEKNLETTDEDKELNNSVPTLLDDIQYVFQASKLYFTIEQNGTKHYHKGVMEISYEEWQKEYIAELHRIKRNTAKNIEKTLTRQPHEYAEDKAMKIIGIGYSANHRLQIQHADAFLTFLEEAGKQELSPYEISLISEMVDKVTNNLPAANVYVLPSYWLRLVQAACDKIDFPERKQITIPEAVQPKAPLTDHEGKKSHNISLKGSAKEPTHQKAA